jgi:hypothetical protein
MQGSQLYNLAIAIEAREKIPIAKSGWNYLNTGIGKIMKSII